MSLKFKNSYSFAIKTSFAISLISLFVVAVVLYLYSLLDQYYFQLILLVILIFIISFLIIQSRIEASILD